MKDYPSITGDPAGFNKQSFLVYPKWDGSNIRVEWTKKRGFHKWGRRNGLLDDSNPIITKAKPLFLAESSELEKYLIDSYGNKDIVTVFMEFFGPKSFAGYHDPNDTHEVKVFDIWIVENQKGRFLTQSEYSSLARSFNKYHLHDHQLFAESIGPGPESFHKIVEQVRQGTYPGQTFEGVIMKDNKSNMIKAKSDAWRNKVKANYKNWEELL